MGRTWVFSSAPKHISGLRVVFPSNAVDAVGQLRTAIRSDDPVLFLEYNFTIPFGKARVAKSGGSLTIVTYGALAQKSLLAAQQIESRLAGISVAVLDLRTLSPYDWALIASSVRKTSRVIVAYEDTLSWGLRGGVGDELFEHLDAPVKRVAAKDTWVAI